MTAGELRNKIAGCGPDIPVLFFGPDFQYHAITARWQNHVHESLARDVTTEEATKGEGILALVLTIS